MSQNNNLDLVISIARQFLNLVSRAFNSTAIWVGKLSWWKFFLFACLMLVAGSIIQDSLLNNDEEIITTKKTKNPKKPGAQITDKNTTVEFNNNGIHIRKNTGKNEGKRLEIDENGVHVKSENGDAETIMGEPPMPPAAPEIPAKSAEESSKKMGPGAIAGQDEIHIRLPADIAKEVSQEINDAVAEAADEEVRTYQKNSKKWFGSLVLLIVFGLFGMKALMGGKVRAEEKAHEAHLAAEREALLRQVSEAQVQMMQAQVEPHFLFNTLASVEHLIETDPPRAAAMQRSLIAYLRAVLPQMRESNRATNLGREADMIKAYLDLLKMRMEERLTIDYEMPEGLRSASFPPMMLQSLVENAIKHGLECKEEGGTIRFRAEVAHNKLRVSVTDDGMGFGVKPSPGTGLGLQNIRERLKLLYKEKGQMIISPNQPSGVCVTIEIPYELAQ